MVRNDATDELFELARKVAKEDLDMELEEASVCDGSDGNFTANMEVPTLDGHGCRDWHICKE